MTLPSASNPTVQVCNLSISWEDWRRSPGEKIFQLLEYFKHLVSVSQELRLETPKCVSDLIFGKFQRLSAEGIEINTDLLRCIDVFSKYWVEHKAIPTEMPVSGRVFFSVKDKVIRLGRLGEFSVKPKSEISELERGRIQVKSATINRNNGRAEITLIIQHWGKRKAVPKQFISSNKTSLSETKCSKVMDLDIFFRMLDKHEAMLSKILSPSTSWERLSGRPVSGGLPSLGKRS